MPVAERDPNAVRLLQIWPAPNLPPLSPEAPGRYQVSSPNINNTRQETLRLDYDGNDALALYRAIHPRPQ